MTELQKLMTLLDLSEQEARELMEFDKMVNKEGGNDPTLTAEQKETVRKMCGTTSEKKQVRHREYKPDEGKINLLNKLISNLEGIATNVIIETKERIFTCNVNGIKYRITITKPRKK